MPNITYLIGAGASANALPLIKKNIETKKYGLAEELINFIRNNISTLLQFNEGWDSSSIQTLTELADRCLEFGTPDLYAKFLMETGDNFNYRLLKNLLSVYFKYEQEIKQSFDYRALTFLTTITQSQRIPENIKILSWNYDVQIELAAKKLNPLSPIGYPFVQGFKCWPNIEDGEQNSNIPFLLHLNGVAGFHYSDRNLSQKIDKHYHFKSVLDKEILLSFAWEDENIVKNNTFFENRLKITKDIASQTEILVVIGYSFPFFNRKIDKEIFESMNPSIRKIYFQDPFNNGERIKELFDLNEVARNNIIHVAQTENYHIPFEL